MQGPYTSLLFSPQIFEVKKEDMKLHLISLKNITDLTTDILNYLLFQTKNIQETIGVQEHLLDYCTTNKKDMHTTTTTADQVQIKKKQKVSKNLPSLINIMSCR